MRTTLAAVLIVAAAAAALWWARRAPSPTPVAPARADVVAVRAPDIAALAPAPRPPAPPPSLPSEPVAVDPDLARELDGVALQLRHAARPCLDRRTTVPEPPPPGEPDESLDRMSLKLRIVYAGGTGAIASAERTAEGFTDEALERCVLEAIRAARWDAPRPDGEVGVEQEIYVGELMGRDRLAPPRRDVPRAQAPVGVPPPGAPPAFLPPPPPAT